MSKNLTVVEYVINRLADLGIDRAFGVPGDYSFPINDAIEFSSRMKWVVCANELNASYAADGYARRYGLSRRVLHPDRNCGRTRIRSGGSP